MQHEHEHGHAQPHKPTLSEALYVCLRDAMLPVLNQHIGHDNCIPRAQLLAQLLEQIPGLGSHDTADRRMREAAALIVEREHIPICTFPDAGYCLPATLDEAVMALRVIRKYQGSLRDRGDTLVVAMAHYFKCPVQTEMEMEL
jgi:hypothetical protein